MNFTPVIVGHKKLIFSFFIAYDFVNNKWTVIAKKVIFLENIGILILVRMLPIQIWYIEPFSRNYDFHKKFIF